MRLTVADDHRIVRVGLRSILQAQPDIEVVGEAGSLADALAQILSLEPDVAVLDVNMPGGSGLSVVREVRKKAEKVRLLVLSMHSDWEVVREAITAGAHGYLSKVAEPEEIIQAVRSVAAGRAFLSVPVESQRGSIVPSEAPESPRSSAPPGLALSLRERQVLELFARGYTHRQIADLLGVRAKTVETYRGRLGVKFGASSRAELVRKGQELGILRQGPLPLEP